jgi:hypothetical protein
MQHVGQSRMLTLRSAVSPKPQRPGRNNRAFRLHLKRCPLSTECNTSECQQERILYESSNAFSHGAGAAINGTAIH